ncbi:acyl carrier protein [Francisella philomiragia]|uniref:Phosphopantetheine attachment site family protein n=2 Tax=Francisella philomiragia TaxID=28110 RepID=A0AAW3DBP5_9GAMM|nr:phosphopantetheine-binding protein [Francisella philomiragia]AJI46715.1 phosphopantetheine attachment site family protein [Francisella philomiragia]AJI49325.1 phosphopantetheine attachment site family protein [Francisella philomiragia]AJI55585.1 phosphopantetheine attachment site family protein [Francisella philomiragia]AJI74274.1 phosphopantetheine attachment site family protein [Francisella philomiragia subsp. philomiragia ATCC 25015]EET20844.1 acyl carrier protein [Francisella philomirag
MQQEIKEMIIEVLNLEDITADEIDANEALFGEGLGLDSIDALEIGVALKKRYNISLEVADEDVKKHFESVASLAKFVEENKS